MKKVMVALVTPFTEADEVDYVALKKIIKRLMKEGCDGFIVCGTTAEVSTITKEERFKILEFVIKEVNHRVEIWFGCGNNCTRNTIAICKEAQQYDITGILLVTPYYNKPTQEGIYQHYKAIADAVPLDIMLYNVPSRTIVEQSYETIDRLLQTTSNIKALKHASKDLEIARKLKRKHPDFLIYSGEDDYIDEGLDAGMDGLISVMGHVNLKQIKKFIKGGCKDNLEKKKLTQMAHAIFLESSPSPIKYVLHKRGDCEEYVRLPLVGVSVTTKELLDSIF